MKTKSEKLSEGAEAVDAPETEKAPEASTEKPEAVSETAETVVEPEASETKPEALSKVELQRFSEKFGAEKAMSYLLAGTSFEEALSIEFDSLKTKEKVAREGGSRGEKEPVGTFGKSEKKEVSTSKVIDTWANRIIRLPGQAKPSQN